MPLRHALLAALGGALLLGAPVRAQTTHVVNVTNTTFTPGTLTIDEGDTVEWQNTLGCHNVHETTAGTPAGFGNAVACAPWTYSFTFGTPGEYTYICEVHAPGPGVPGMEGSITVLPATAAEERPAPGFRLAVSPNPFDQAAAIRVGVDRSQAVRVAVLDLAGREVAVLHEGIAAAGTDLDLTWAPPVSVASGVYLVHIDGESFSTSRRLTLSR